MKKVDGWECSDGKRFFSEKDAKIHEASIEVEEKLMEDPLFFHGGLAGVENGKDMMEFLERNEEWILRVMQWRPAAKCDFTVGYGDSVFCRTCQKTMDETDNKCPKG